VGIGFEFQGPRHYYHGAVGQRDREKELVCKSRGICFIYIPFWWEHTPSSLIASIRGARPDLLSAI